jgi:hypothetical protein
MVPAQVPLVDGGWCEGSITPSAGTPRFVDDDVGFLYEREVVGRWCQRRDLSGEEWFQSFTQASFRIRSGVTSTKIQIQIHNLTGRHLRMKW